MLMDTGSFTHSAQSSLAKDVRRKALLKTGLGVLKRGIARKTVSRTSALSHIARLDDLTRLPLASQALAQVADRFADRTITREWFLGASFAFVYRREPFGLTELPLAHAEWRARLLRTKQLQQTEAVARAKSEQVRGFSLIVGACAAYRDIPVAALSTFSSHSSRTGGLVSGGWRRRARPPTTSTGGRSRLAPLPSGRPNASSTASSCPSCKASATSISKVRAARAASAHAFPSPS
jgi:hypothetical protein